MTTKFITAILLSAFLCINITSVSAEEYDTLFGSWAGVKDSLKESGVTVEAFMLTDQMHLAKGGLDRGTGQIFNYNLAFEVDTEQAGLWSDGTFLLSAIGINGRPLYDRVGDIQFTSNIDGMGVDTVSFLEAWYEHSFADGKFTLLAGFHDYNSEFYALDYAFALINSSFGFGLENSQSGISTYPVTALGLRARAEFGDSAYLLLGAYDGIAGDPDNFHGNHVNLSTRDGAFYTAELGKTSNEADSLGNYYKVAIGGWYRTTDYVDYGDTLNTNTGGVYLIGETQVYAESDPSQGLGVFAQLGAAEAASNEVAEYIGLGLHYTGLFPARDEDVTALGMAQVRRGDRFMSLTPESDRSETAIEITHSASLGHGIRLQPDLQYVLNPGTDKSIGNALIFGSRVEIAF